jgi:hypothetical protein
MILKKLRLGWFLTATMAGVTLTGGCQSSGTTSASSNNQSKAPADNRARADYSATQTVALPLREPDPHWKCPLRPKEELQEAANFQAMNEVFRASYASERNTELNSIPVVLIARFSCVTLFRNGKIVETKRVIPAEYHNLRYCSHVPFAVYLKLSRHTGSDLDGPFLDELRKYQGLIQAAKADLAKMPFTNEQRPRQEYVLARTLEFLGKVIAADRVSREELRAYARDLSEPMRKNTREAAKAQILGLDRQLRDWRKQIPDNDWRNLRVVVHGPQQARCDYVVTQYFAAMFQDHGDNRGYPGESRRLVYCEDNAGNPEGPAWDGDLTLLAATNLDADASEAFFADPDRLSVDVMADGAKEYLRTFDFTDLR